MQVQAPVMLPYRRLVGLSLLCGSATLVAGCWMGSGSGDVFGESESALLAPELDGALPDWVHPVTGEVIDERVPDYLPIWDRTSTHIVGVVSRDYIVPRNTSVAGEPFDVLDAAPWPVLDREGGVLIGHVFPGVGFVSLEEQARGPIPVPSPSTTVVEGHFG